MNHKIIIVYNCLTIVQLLFIIPQVKKVEMPVIYISLFSELPAHVVVCFPCGFAPSGLASTDDLAEAKVWDRIWPVTGRSTRAPMLSVVVTDDDLNHNRLGMYKHAHGHPTR